MYKTDSYYIIIPICISDIMEDDLSIIHNASYCGDYDTVLGCLQNIEDIDCKDEYGNTALHLASHSGNIDIVKILLENGAEIDCKLVNGGTAIQLASIGGHLETVKILIDTGCNIWYETNTGETALSCAVSSGHIDIVTFLMGLADDDYHFGIELSNASFHGHFDIVELLIYKGSNINYTSNEGYTALHYAVENAHFKIARLLIMNGIDIEKETYQGYTALHLASIDGYANIVKLLITEGACIDAISHQGCSPLFLASNVDHITADHIEIITILIENKANLNLEAAGGTVPLIQCAVKGHTAVLQLLLDNGANINAKEDVDGYTALHASSHNNRSKIVTVLVEYGANLESVSTFGETPLLVAVECGHTQIVKTLLSYGADVNSQNYIKATALHIVIETMQFGQSYFTNDKYFKIMMMLVNYRANPNIKNQYTKTVLDMIKVYYLKNIFPRYAILYQLKEWRPWNHQKYLLPYRNCITTLNIISKSEAKK